MKNIFLMSVLLISGFVCAMQSPKPKGPSFPLKPSSPELHRAQKEDEALEQMKKRGHECEGIWLKGSSTSPKK